MALSKEAKEIIDFFMIDAETTKEFVLLIFLLGILKLNNQIQDVSLYFRSFKLDKISKFYNNV